MISALIGFAVSFAPELLKVFRERADRKQEVALLKLQMERDEKVAAGKIQELRMAGAQALALGAQEADLARDLAADKNFQIAQESGARRALEHRSGIRWIDALLGLCDVLNSSVRPVLTYSFNGAFLWQVLEGSIALAAQGPVSAWGLTGPQAFIELTLAIDGYWFGMRMQKNASRGRG